MTENITDNNYKKFLDDLKSRVETSRYQATLSVNRELVLLYHHIGTEILKSQNKHGWGAKIIGSISFLVDPFMRKFRTLVSQGIIAEKASLF